MVHQCVDIICDTHPLSQSPHEALTVVKSSRKIRAAWACGPVQGNTTIAPTSALHTSDILSKHAGCVSMQVSGLFRADALFCSVLSGVSTVTSNPCITVELTPDEGRVRKRDTDDPQTLLSP